MSKANEIAFPSF